MSEQKKPMTKTEQRKWEDARRELVAFLRRHGQEALTCETNEDLKKRVAKIRRGF